MTVTRLMVLACLLPFALQLHADETTPELIPVLLSQKIGDHPRLFLNAGEVEALKGKIDADPQLVQVRAELLARAEELLSVPPLTRVMKGKRLLSVSRSCFQRVTDLSMAWLLTKDARFLDRARAEMLAVAEFTDWNPPHFLDVAEMTAALAIGYDWLYPALDQETRTKVRNAIVEKGIAPSFATEPAVQKNLQFWIKGTNNWNQVCHGGLTLGALAVAEDEPKLAARVIARAVENVPRAMQKEYAPDGAYPEGPGYWQYGTKYNVLMIAALESVLGTDFALSQQPGFLASSDYMVHVVGPTGLFFNYSDCFGDSENDVPATMYWFAARRNDPALLRHAERDMHSTAKQGIREQLPFILIWAPSQKSVVPRQLDWSGGGPAPVAMFRSGWERDALYVGIKGGSPSESHAHMDVGSFVFDAQGVRWAIALGPQDYNGLESRGIHLFDGKQNGDRWNIFRLSNASKNMLVINDKLQNVAGKVEVVTHGLGTASPEASMDCSSVFAGEAQKVIRTVSFPGRHALVVEDAVQCVAASGNVRWQMATQADITLSGTEAVLRQEGKTLRVQCASPTQGKWSVIDISVPRSDFDAPNPGAKLLVLNLPVAAGDSPRITVRLTPES